LEKFEMLSTIARYSLRSLLLFSCLAVAEIAFCQQDDILSRIYGMGVHAYFGGDYRQAHERLTTTIESGNRDPRAYYFRGLTYQKLGRPEQAKQDFAKAADIEVQDGNLADPVSRALMRIQGPTRLELENYRTEARRKINKRHGEMDQDRFTPRGKERQSPEPVLEPEEEASDDNEDATSSSEEEADDASQKDEGTDEPEKPKDEPEDPFAEDETDELEKPKDEPEDPFKED
jgi:tetratricopeptide (TPR) repeat protein